MAKMPFAEDNHMIEAVPPDRTDQPTIRRWGGRFAKSANLLSG
jgi:hypothetical protein